MRIGIKGVIGYLLFTFGIAWAFWCIPLLFGLTLGSPFYMPLLIAGAFSPAVAAVVVRRWVTGEGFIDAGLRLAFRKNWFYYLVAWLLPLPVVTIIVLLAIALGVSEPDFSLERTMGVLASGQNPLRSIPAGLRLPLVGICQGLLIAVVATPILWGEEFGWRGYLQIRLLAHRPVLGAVVTGAIWGVWHYPVNLQGYNYPDNRILGLLLFPIFTILLSIILGWLRQRTGSVWPASLGHSATNAVGGGLTLLLFWGEPNWVFVSYAGILAWIPLGALCMWIVFKGQLRSAEEV